MKKIYVFVFGMLFSASTFAQGTITGFVIDPPAPTTADFVRVYASVMFTSMGCDVDNQGHSTAGSTTSAYAHHCIGMLTAICNTVDTFDLGYLPAGAHVFDMTLTSGSGGPPCTPGIVPDDTRNTTFTVTTATGITEYNKNDLLIFPNPMHNSAILQINPLLKLKNAELKVTDVTGRTVKLIPNIHHNELTLDRDQLSNGIYFYSLSQDSELLAKGKFIVE